MKSYKLFSYGSIRKRWSFQRRKRSFRKKALSKDQISLMASLFDYSKSNFNLELKDDKLHSILSANEWDLKRAMAELDDCEEAHHGLLHSTPEPGDTILGCENDGGTSCYIDALLFAMYITLTAFDPLLTYDTSSDKPAKRKLQVSLRLFVNILRKGRLVRQHVVSRLRHALEDADWQGRNERGRYSQEDTSELLLFLTETFELPYLPFQMRLFHGANRDTDDDRVMTDRVLSLSMPGNTVAQPIRLERILFDQFYNNIVIGVKRQVDCPDIHDSVPGSPQSLASMSSIPKKMIISEQRQEVAVNAWQVLELLPFYSGMNEQGEQIRSQDRGSFPDSRMVLPIVLKRYNYDTRGRYIKDQRTVQIPSSINFNQFLNQNADDPKCDTCGQKVEGIMRLRSVVCHKGSSPYSGHYIAYARALKDDHEYWLKLDDLAVSQRVKILSKENEAAIYTELAQDGYLFFYELDKTCQHTLPDTNRTQIAAQDPSSLTKNASAEPSILEDVYSPTKNSTQRAQLPPPTITTSTTSRKSRHSLNNHKCIVS